MLLVVELNGSTMISRIGVQNVIAVAGTRPRPSIAAVSTLFIGNCAGKLHL
jgi:hypothetical protein